MNSELEALREVVGRLDAAGIPYLLTGSVAMAVYAEPRMTRDIDIVIELAGDDAVRIVELFSPDYYVSAEAVEAAISHCGMFNVFSLTWLVKVDLIVRKDDDFERHAFSARHRCDLGGFGVWVIGKEDLILSKLRWAAATDCEFQLRERASCLRRASTAPILASGAPSSGLTPCCGDARMGDTAPEFQAFVDEQYRRLTPAVRVRLCTEMFDAARVLVESSLPPGLSEHERKRRISARFYGPELADRVFPQQS